MAQRERVVALIDLDCFYCACERHLEPSLAGVPIAVVQYNPFENSGGGAGGVGGVISRPPQPAAARLRRGLLLVVDTFSLDRKAATRRTSAYVRNWIDSIEAEGFTFLRHVALARSHAMAFATAPLPAEGQEEPPALRMRREERGEPGEALQHVQVRELDAAIEVQLQRLELWEPGDAPQPVHVRELRAELEVKRKRLERGEAAEDPQPVHVLELLAAV